MAIGSRAYSSGNYAVEVDGLFAGYCKSVDGGKLKGEQYTHNAGPTLRQRKHIVNFSYDKITIEFGLSHSNAMLDWIQAAFKMNHMMKNGAIIHYDHNFKAMRRMDWTNGHLIKVGLPKLSAKGKDGLYVTLEIQPEHVEFTDGGGSVNATMGPKQKLHQSTNFAVQIPGLDCESISEVDLPAFTMKTVQHAVGQHLESEYLPAAVEVGDLKVKLSAHQYKKVYDEARSFLMMGERSEGIEKTIGVTIFGPDGKTPTVELSLENCGYKEVVLANKSEANKEQAAEVEITFYTEQVILTIPQHDM